MLSRLSDDFVPIDFTGKNIYFFGDSITIGLASSSNAVRFTKLLSDELGGVEINYGLSSSTLEKRSPIDPFSAANMIDRISLLPAKSSDKALLVIAYGMNDWGVNSANYNPANFKTDFNTVLDACVTKGWPLKQVLIIAPSYITDSSFAFYESFTGNPAPNRAGMINFQEACDEVAEDRNVNIAFPYYSMNGSHISGDGVHPNDSGHLFMANHIFELFQEILTVNVIIGPNVLVAKKTVSFADAKIKAENTFVIYKTSGGLKSYVPRRLINGIDSFEANKGYYIVAKEEMKLSNILTPPL